MFRDKDIDKLRCVLIVMVVLIHIVALHQRYPFLKPVIYDLSVPSFMVLTGYLTNVRKPWREFAVRWGQWAVLYCVMETCYAVASFYLPVRDGLSCISPRAVLSALLLHPIGPYWFVHAMLWGQLLAYFSYRCFGERMGQKASCALLLSLSLLLVWFTRLVMPTIVLFAVGVCLRRRGVQLSSLALRRDVSVLGLLLWLVLRYAGVNGLKLQLVAFYCSFQLILQPCRRLQSRQMEYIGRNTLPIFIFHPIFTALSHFYYPLFAPDPTCLLFTLFTVALAVAGSLAIASAMDRLHLSRLLGRRRLLQ